MKEPSKMAIENIPPVEAESEREEGEIVDELDDLSDISSEEEYFLRQRLIVLEDYNNVLERKKAKNKTKQDAKLGNKAKNEDPKLHDMSDMSGTDGEDNANKIRMYKNFKVKSIRMLPKQKKRKEPEVLTIVKTKDIKKKTHRNKKKLAPKVVHESSEESEDEYRHKRRKLAEAVVVNTEKNDTSTLRARLKKMLCSNNVENVIMNQTENVSDFKESEENCLNDLENTDTTQLVSKIQHENEIPDEILMNQAKVSELIDLCKEDDDEVKIVENEENGKDCVDSSFIENKQAILCPAADAESDSDVDLEILRQDALKTKATKAKTLQSKAVNNYLLTDEDKDTEALRLICLKSALLKKAIELKQKQKRQKSLSQSFHNEFDLERVSLTNSIEAENNTDVESVDMDIGSDGDEKLRDLPVHGHIIIDNTKSSRLLESEDSNFQNIPNSIKDDEIEEDEDLLRAKLLTSLTKNLPNLVDASGITDVPTNRDKQPTDAKNKTPSIPEQRPLIIELRESDSEGAEDEATKNLTKMHMKLYEQNDFQEKLDLFLKSTRMEVERKAFPDVIQKSPEPSKQSSKFVPKAVRNLPKPEQIEYKNLVKRMAELEKIKQARQYSMSFIKASTHTKETLKPRNVSVETARTINYNLEEEIATSRKKIAAESSKMLKLKEEATKLSQKYKIAATELRNITTAITLNKKEQKSIQNKLSKIRLQHQLLMKSSTSNNNIHSKINMPIPKLGSSKVPSITKVQKENDPNKEEYKNPFNLKSVKVSVVNDLKEDTNTHSRLSVELDVSNNKKIIKLPKNSVIKERIVNVAKNTCKNAVELSNTSHPVVEKGGGDERISKEDTEAYHLADRHEKDANDYVSPLDALHAETWVEDPNSFLCPFDVGGTCKDPDCKYIHPKIPTET